MRSLPSLLLLVGLSLAAACDVGTVDDDRLGAATAGGKADEAADPGVTGARLRGPDCAEPATELFVDFAEVHIYYPGASFEAEARAGAPARRACEVELDVEVPPGFYLGQLVAVSDGLLSTVRAGSTARATAEVSLDGRPVGTVEDRAGLDDTRPLDLRGFVDPALRARACATRTDVLRHTVTARFGAEAAVGAADDARAYTSVHGSVVTVGVWPCTDG